MAYCSKCGAQNADGAKFCNYCAAPLGTTPPAGSQGPAPQQGPFQQPTQPQQPVQPQFQPGQRVTLLDMLSHYEGLQIHWAKRFVALLFDAILVMIPVYVFMVFLSLMTGIFWFMGAGGFFLFLYSAFFEYATGATIGKAILGLKVSSTKGKLELPDTIIRNITKIYSLFLLLEFILTLVLETTDAHQRYLDKLAKTTVGEKRQ